MSRVRKTTYVVWTLDNYSCKVRLNYVLGSCLENTNGFFFSIKENQINEQLWTYGDGLIYDYMSVFTWSVSPLVELVLL